jgi:hypothetical protein
MGWARSLAVVGLLADLVERVAAVERSGSFCQLVRTYRLRCGNRPKLVAKQPVHRTANASASSRSSLQRLISRARRPAWETEMSGVPL